MKKNIEVKGLKKAVGDYQKANAGGAYDARYGTMMLDCNTGELWTDEFYSLGHNDWKEYHEQSIINLSGFMMEHQGEDFKVNMVTVKEYAIKAIEEYNE